MYFVIGMISMKIIILGRNCDQATRNQNSS